MLHIVGIVLFSGESVICDEMFYLQHEINWLVFCFDTLIGFNIFRLTLKGLVFISTGKNVLIYQSYVNFPNKFPHAYIALVL